MESRPPEPPWWERPGLRYNNRVLHLEGENLADLAGSLGTPLYLYSLPRVEANLRRLADALAGTSVPVRLFYAMKSNRHPALLSHLRALGLCGIDVCSPEEARLARQMGFAESSISFTGNSVSQGDLEALSAFPHLWINVDSFSTMRRLAEWAPGREMGIRINPGIGVGYRTNDRLQYAGTRTTKFGIYEADFPRAVDEARKLGLNLRGIHFHAGCGYLDSALESWSRILGRVRSFLEHAPEVRHLNVGGGLGIPLVEGDRPLDLSRWAELVEGKLGDLGVEIWMEPGDYLVKDAGVLLLTANTVEIKEGIRFVGVDGGFNLHPEPAFYDLPLEIVPVSAPSGPPSHSDPLWSSSTPAVSTVVGNINEALDVWGSDLALPPIREGDVLAFLNAGGYGAAMSSNHCMRGAFREMVIHG